MKLQQKNNKKKIQHNILQPENIISAHLKWHPKLTPTRLIFNLFVGTYIREWQIDGNKIFGAKIVFDLSVRVPFPFIYHSEGTNYP